VAARIRVNVLETPTQKFTEVPIFASVFPTPTQWDSFPPRPFPDVFFFSIPHLGAKLSEVGIVLSFCVIGAMRPEPEPLR